jgi:DNA-damage-inducible protein J
MTTTVQIRIDKKIKQEAQKAFHSMGLDLSSGVKIFLSQVVRTQSIPFDVLSANYLSEDRKLELIYETNQALKFGKRYKSIKEAHKDILRK